MSSLEIHHIVSKENINKDEWLVKHFSPEEKKDLENKVDHWLLQWDQILKQDKQINENLSLWWEKRLFKPIDSDLATIDEDKHRGAVLKIADEDKDWNLETKEYNKHKETIADAFVRSKNEYFKDMKIQETKDAPYENQEKKIVLNDVRNEIAWLKNAVFSTNSYSVAANNYDPEKRAWNSVPENIATNNKIDFTSPDYIPQKRNRWYLKSLSA